MSGVRLADLEGLHRGETVWVLGSGPSLSYIEPSFFADKVTIGVNLVTQQYAPTTYSVTKYHELAQQLIDAGVAAERATRVVVSLHQHGNCAKPTTDLDRPDCWVFEHNDNPGEDLSRWTWPADGGLVSSHSSIGSALHLAAHLGARFCVLVGHDCGVIDDEQHIRGYTRATRDALWKQYPSFERQSILIKQELHQRYGMEVHSLNPFINFNLEGHRFFSRHTRINVPLSAVLLGQAQAAWMARTGIVRRSKRLLAPAVRVVRRRRGAVDPSRGH